MFLRQIAEIGLWEAFQSLPAICRDILKPSFGVSQIAWRLRTVVCRHADCRASPSRTGIALQTAGRRPMRCRTPITMRGPPRRVARRLSISAFMNQSTSVQASFPERSHIPALPEPRRRQIYHYAHAISSNAPHYTIIPPPVHNADFADFATSLFQVSFRFCGGGIAHLCDGLPETR